MKKRTKKLLVQISPPSLSAARLNITDRQEYESQQATHAWLAAADASTPRDARRWLERSYRFASGDQDLAFALASTRLADGDAAAARTLFETIAARHPTREVLAGLAASALATGDRAAAAASLARALAHFVPNQAMLALARACAGGSGWCGLDDVGRLLIDPPGPVLVTLDGVPADPGPAGALPQAWRTSATLAVTHAGRHLLGSPIDLAARRRTEGFVALTPTGIEGWAWHPAAPETDPVLHILQGRRTVELTATEPAAMPPPAPPLARPRAFSYRCDTARAALRVLGRDGRDLWGSPLGGPAPRRPAPRRPAPGPAPRPGAGTAVIIPVYRDAAATRACLHSVLATRAPGDTIIVVNDAAPEPALVAHLRQLAGDGAITVLPSCADDPARNMGFPAAVNAGLAAAAGRDVVLLNSDTVVFPGWLAGLRAAAHGAPDIGTATPISNDATIFTYPDAANPAPMPAQADGAALARLAARANRGTVIDVPTAHGFCMFIRADCLHRTGLFRADLFAQGYGEENDFCERARALGFRHVAVPGIYVAHQGGASFGAAKAHLLRRNFALLQSLHPTYTARVHAFIAADPIAPARRRLDRARLRAAHRNDAPGIILVTHAGRGGTTRVVEERAAHAMASGRLPILLRGDEGITLLGADGAYPNLRYRLPQDAGRLLRLLRALRPAAVEMHHRLGHHPALLPLLERLGLPTEIWVHDYGCLCPRLTFVTGDGRFCGEAPPTACVPCVARWDQVYVPPIDAASLRTQSARQFIAARRVVAASADVAARIRRHFPAAPIDIVPLQPNPAPRPRAPAPLTMTPLTVAVVGAISRAKGYDVLLACAEDAAARNLPLQFVVIGYTLDDTPLLRTRRVFVTGPYQSGEAPALIAQSRAGLAFLPSIWPETWCYALSDAWDGGLNAAVFDIGTPAERVRRTGRGIVLPLGLSPSGVNDALLNHQSLARRSVP